MTRPFRPFPATVQAGRHNVVMQNRGFLNPRSIWRFSFWTISACLLVAVVASILAIWQFAGTDALWRTVATCARHRRRDADVFVGEWALRS